MIDVLLDYSGVVWYNWMEKLALYNKWREWLKANAVIYQIVRSHEHEALPSAFRMSTEDALAFKLMFGK